MLSSTSSITINHHHHHSSNTNDPHKLIKKITANLESQLFYHTNCVKSLTMVDDSHSSSNNNSSKDAGLICDNMLANVPPSFLHDFDDTAPENAQLLHSLSCLFRSLIHVDWLTHVLSGAIRTACQRANELGASWKKELCSSSFASIVDRLSLLYRSGMHEACRIRTQPGFDERDMSARNTKSEKGLVYRIRIVCQEGAIVRNGIDIDRCENVGNLEMGEIVYAYGE